MRRRSAQAGLPRPESVHLVSSTKHRGVYDLLEDLYRAAGSAGDVWVVRSWPSPDSNHESGSSLL